MQHLVEKQETWLRIYYAEADLRVLRLHEAQEAAELRAAEVVRRAQVGEHGAAALGAEVPLADVLQVAPRVNGD